MGKNVHISQFLLISHNSQHERRKENIWANLRRLVTVDIQQRENDAKK
jgi:hypothetical protein